ncbi:putative hydrolase YxeP [Clostridium acetireducens DSM 10703]|jgi:amidohydrolase|uniref:Putative hydrolase YxeP n=1 Tax=Clostridium acetireducens DSM 10703 TaxID=1121290 RepID=A0A1E8EXQ6_9CLOT|nr:M20 family metallopeptidase [Clostridium acetireducens]OFI05455.1 putative hydrolase YxeP [Clostridium acetireducens DSM 10703]
MNKIAQLAKKYKKEIINYRREFHMYPEASKKEFRTSKRIMEELHKIEVPCRIISGTGVIAEIKGNNFGKTVALRADIDALNVREKNNVPYKSKNEGLMHACGHDCHIAMLIGAAKILNNMKDEIKGTVKLFFQPAEELASGARDMIKEGAMEGVDGVFAIHVWSGLDSGKISAESGPRMAAADLFKITVKGKGGHGAMPQVCKDALVTASAIVMNLQSIVSREISPFESAVLTVGKLISGTRFNVIAGEAIMEGTTRCYSKEVREILENSMKRVIEDTAKSYGAEANLEYSFGTPPTINDENCSSIAIKSIEKIAGKDAISKMEKLAPGEDFAEYMSLAPGALAFLGVRNKEKDAFYSHHNERFNVDEDVLDKGAALYAQYAIDFLNDN